MRTRTMHAPPPQGLMEYAEPPPGALATAMAGKRWQSFNEAEAIVAAKRKGIDYEEYRKSLPEPSVNGAGRKPPAERRARRMVIERAMIDGMSSGQILDEAPVFFSVSRRTVGSDMRTIRERWAKQDAKQLDGLRAETMRRLQRIAEKAEADKQYPSAVAAAVALGRFLGMGNPSLTLNQDNRRQTLVSGMDRVAMDRMLKDPATREATMRLLQAHTQAQMGRPPGDEAMVEWLADVAERVKAHQRVSLGPKTPAEVAESTASMVRTLQDATGQPAGPEERNGEG